jgi:hypothetical protein
MAGFGAMSELQGEHRITFDNLPLSEANVNWEAHFGQGAALSTSGSLVTARRFFCFTGLVIPATRGFPLRDHNVHVGSKVGLNPI